jgi:uncharacterized membrane protein YeaQ/YmgE (transglycosylase-associated protein family)
LFTRKTSALFRIAIWHEFWAIPVKNARASQEIKMGQKLYTGGELMGILAWIVFGLIAGALAKFIMPGNDPGGFIVTTIIGILGAVIGGFIGVQLGFNDVTGFDVRSFVIAIVGTLILLFDYRLLKKA